VAAPTLLESLQHVVIRKVAINSGGKHCLALSSDGEVYSWGEGEDGKLGHGNKLCVSLSFYSALTNRRLLKSSN